MTAHLLHWNKQYINFLFANSRESRNSFSVTIQFKRSPGRDFPFAEIFMLLFAFLTFCTMQFCYFFLTQYQLFGVRKTLWEQVASQQKIHLYGKWQKKFFVSRFNEKRCDAIGKRFMILQGHFGESFMNQGYFARKLQVVLCLKLSLHQAEALVQLADNIFPSIHQHQNKLLNALAEYLMNLLVYFVNTQNSQNLPMSSIYRASQQRSLKSSVRQQNIYWKTFC